MPWTTKLKARLLAPVFFTFTGAIQPIYRAWWSLAISGLLCTGLATADEFYEEAPRNEIDELGFGVDEDKIRIPTRGKLNVLVVYAKFSGEGLDSEPAPESSAPLFDANHPGSFSHFYQTMSFGQLQIKGVILPRYYISDLPASAYLAPNAAEHGRYAEFVEDILQKVDADYDMGQFDNDGPDGMPNSGDDDGLVDYVFVILKSVPTNLLYGPATGIAGLGKSSFVTRDIGANGQPIQVLGSPFRGTILEGGSFARTVGIMAHEFGHSLGRHNPLPDLYDRSHLDFPNQDAAAYSAGIGRWGLMGLGTLGWQKNGQVDGPNAFSPWSLEQLGWIGPNNERLIEIGRDTTQVRIADLFQGGVIYKIPMLASVDPRRGRLSPEYLLLEYRSKSGPYYNRNIPGEGLLVWRVQSLYRENKKEETKRVDLVSADGLYRDSGFDLGREQDPYRGYDNLDFWAKDALYRQQHAGNVGDGTDPFDGLVFTHLGGDSNPSSLFDRAHATDYLPPSIGPMRRDGDAMVVDIGVPRWAGTIHGEVIWAGEVVVDGDLRVAPDATLRIYPGTRVQITRTDRLAAGLDPERVEFEIDGDLFVYHAVKLYDPDEGDWLFYRAESLPVVFAALEPGQTWAGIRSKNALPLERIALRDTLTRTSQTRNDDGDGSATAVEAKPNLISSATDTFALQPNYPNPFDTQTTLVFSLGQRASVQLYIYNAIGQIVRSLADGYLEAGRHEIVWDGRDESGLEVSRGVYLYRLEVPGQYRAGGKMLFLASGFSRAEDLEKHLGLAAMETMVSDQASAIFEDVSFGITEAKIALPWAAFVSGRLWVGVQVLAGYAAARTPLEDQAKELLEWLVALDANPAQVHQFKALLEPWAALPQKQRSKLRDTLGQVLENIVQNRGEEAGLYFHLGAWLQNLRLSAQVAQRRSVALADLLDAAADGHSARVFAEALSSADPQDALKQALEQLAAQLENKPRTLTEGSAVLSRIGEIGDLVRGIHSANRSGE